MTRCSLTAAVPATPDGDSLTYTWSFVSKPGGSNAVLVQRPRHKAYLCSRCCRYIHGAADRQRWCGEQCTGYGDHYYENTAPVSKAGADQAVRVNDTVQLDGSGSSDADGDSLTFNWSLVSKPVGSNASCPTARPKPTFVADAAGTYTVQLIVNDGTVNSAPDTVTISTENSAPLSDAGADQTMLVNDTVQLDGSGSSDVDGDSLTFAWSFVSRPGGSNAALSDTTAVKPTFEVDVAGTYTVQLIVNDGTVNSPPDTVTISTENSAPVANAGADQAVLVNDTVQLDGSGSSDVDGDSLTFKWSFVSKPGGSNAVLSDTTAVKPTFDVDVAGTLHGAADRQRWYGEQCAGYGDDFHRELRAGGQCRSGSGGAGQ